MKARALPVPPAAHLLKPLATAQGGLLTGGRRAPAGEAWVLPKPFEHEPGAEVLRVWARFQEDEGDLWAPNPWACPPCHWGSLCFKRTCCVRRDSSAGCHL